MKTSSTEATSVNNCVTILLLTTFAKPTTLQTMIHFNHKLFILCILLCFAGKTGWGQLQVTVGHDAEELIEMLLGTGVEVSNVSSTGFTSANNPNIWQVGKFMNGIAAGVSIDSGVLMTCGDALLAPGPNSGGGVGPGNGNPGDDDLQAIAGGNNSIDAAVIEFDFIPYYDTIRFRYVFGSDEYHMYAPAPPDVAVNDIFAFFVTSLDPTSTPAYFKKNIAVLPNTNTPVSIGTINFGNENGDCPKGNSCTNCEYLIDNCEQGKGIEYDAYTIVITALLIVEPCKPYHIKLAISDVQYNNYDSGVFLEAGSFSSPGVALEPIYTTPGDEPFAVEGCTQANLKITLPFANPVTSWVVFDSITGTATNGVDYNLLNDSVMFLPNQLSVTIPIVPVYDGLAEGDENIFIYLSNQVGCAGTNLQRTEIVLHDFTPVEIGSDTAVCEGTQVTFDAGEGYKNYTWHDGSHGDTWTSPGTPSVTQVSVSILDNYGCPSSDALQLTTYQQPAQNPIKHQ